jgi:hypothetical protein
LENLLQEDLEPIEKIASIEHTSIESIATVVFTDFYTLNSLLKREQNLQTFQIGKFKIVGNYY